ncbi:MAG: right-handed parallel beta-helix repeat-containing protein [Deltaproteobacteria bacterium]|nr:right-handed parallel beta-helix repeat-containing protein [Deltaproteobacteria bacterium]
MKRLLPTLLLLGLATEASAQTSVPGGNLVGSQSWTPAGSPYLISGDLTVPVGLTLTIQAGTVVQLGPGDTQASGLDVARTELRIAGTLVVQGTVQNRVTFRSGVGAPTTSDWYGLVLLSGASTTLNGAAIQHGHRGIHDQSTGAAVNDALITNCNYGVQVEGGSPTFAASQIESSTAYGLYALSNANVTFRDGVIFGSTSYGLYASDAHLTLERSLLRNNGNRGVYLRTTTGNFTQSLVHNTISGNGTYGVYLYEQGGVQNVVLRDNLVVANGSYGFYVTSGSPAVTSSNNLVWDQITDFSGVSVTPTDRVENPLLVDPANGDFRPTSRSGARLAASDGTDIGAFAFDGVATPVLAGRLLTNTVLTAAASPHQVVGDLIVEPGVTLTIEPGAEVRFAALSDLMRTGVDLTRTELSVRGTLVADGTASSGIRLRSTAAAPMPGDWYGVHLRAGSAASILDYATVQHARYGVHSEAAASTVLQRSTFELSASYGVYATAGALDLVEVLIRNNTSYGLYFTDAGGSIQRSQIYDNGNRGLYLRTTAGTSNVQLLRNTIVANGTYGIYFYEQGGQLNVTARDNLVVNNGSYGLYVTSGSPAFTNSNNLVWGQITNLSGVSLGSGDVTENPLFVDYVARDLRLTSNSPGRLHASDGADIGARPYDGVDTVGVQGHLYSATTWGPGQVDVLGDVTIEPGVTLTIQPNTSVHFVALQDSMAANVDLARTELIVLGRLVSDGNPNARVTFRSAGASPLPGDWYGVRLTASAGTTSLEHTVVEHARYGLESNAPATTTVSQSELRLNSSYGAYVTGGALILDGVSIHDNTSYGLYANDSSPSIRNAIIYRNGNRGIYLRTTAGTQNVEINHATIWSNGTYGVYLYEQGGQLNVGLRNTIIAENGSYGVYVTSGSPAVTLAANNVWSQITNYSGVSAPIGALSANPQFVDTSLFNFHLLPNSPCIDVGDSASALNHDAEGGLRPLDGDNNATLLPDIGAFELNPSGNRWPIADAGPDRIVTSGLPATFDGLGSVDPDGNIASWVWDFGDGTPAQSGAMVNHTFSGGTDRVVTLTVTDNAGAIDIDVLSVEVNLPPTADAGAERYADPGEVIAFSGAGSTDTDGTLAQHRWDFGDGTQATGSSVNHQYAQGGDYTVTLTVTDDDGATNSDTTIAHITGVDAAPPMFTHTAVSNGQPAGQGVLVTVVVTDSSGVGSVTLRYRAQGGGNFATLPLTLGGTDTYQGQIPGPAVQAPAVEYYFEATDLAATPNSGTLPPAGGVFAFTVLAGDTAAPNIQHVPIAADRPEGQDVLIAANVTDASGVANVNLYYRASGGGGFGMTSLNNTGADTWTGAIPGGAVTLAGVDYYLEATDQAAAANRGTLPSTAPGTPYSFTVTRDFGVSAGDLVISEIMADPSGSETVREWFEIYNTTNRSLNVSGFTFADNGSDDFTISGNLMIGAGDYVVLGRSSDTAVNGGVTVDYVYTGFNLANSTDEIVILAGALEVDRLEYDDGVTFPDAPGKSLSLDPGSLEYQANDQGSAWCEATSTLPSGDFGTPGAVNDPCQPAVDTTPPVILHAPVPNGQQAGLDVLVTALVTDAGGVRTVELHYRATGGSSFTPLTLANVGGDAYQGTLPGGAVTTAGVDYYLRAVDQATPNNEAIAPLNGMNAPHQFTVGATDQAGPTILHRPMTTEQPAGTAVNLLARVTDQSAITGVRVYYRTPGGNFQDAPLGDQGGGLYAGAIPANAVVGPGVEYYLEATDAGGNDGVSPATAPAAFYNFPVVTTDLDPPVIVHAKISDGQPRGAAVEIRAEVTDGSGVAEVRVYFRSSGEATFLSAELAGTGGNAYQGQIPAALASGTGIDYYLEASDLSPDQNVSHDPANAPAEVHTFTLADLGGDLEPPALLHLPITGEQPKGVAIAIVAEVVDGTGVASVNLHFRATGSNTFTELPLLPEPGTDRWQVQIPAAAVNGSGLEYYLSATDTAPAANRALRPAGAPGELFRFTIGTGTPQPTPDPNDTRDEGGCGCHSTHRGTTSLFTLLLLFGLWALRRR